MRGSKWRCRLAKPFVSKPAVGVANIIPYDMLNFSLDYVMGPAMVSLWHSCPTSVTDLNNYLRLTNKNWLQNTLTLIERGEWGEERRLISIRCQP